MWQKRTYELIERLVFARKRQEYADELAPLLPKLKRLLSSSRSEAPTGGRIGINTRAWRFIAENSSAGPITRKILGERYAVELGIDDPARAADLLSSTLSWAVEAGLLRRPRRAVYELVRQPPREVTR